MMQMIAINIFFIFSFSIKTLLYNDLVLVGRFAQNYKKIDYKNYQKMDVRTSYNNVPFFL